MQNVLTKHEMFEEIGGGEMSKQGQEVVVVSCQAKNVGQFRQAFTHCNLQSCINLKVYKLKESKGDMETFCYL